MSIFFLVLLSFLTSISYCGAIDVFNTTNNDLKFSLHKHYISKNNNILLEQTIPININHSEKHRENFSFTNNIDDDEISEVVFTFKFDKRTYILSKLREDNIISAQISMNEDGAYFLMANTEKGLATGILKSITPKGTMVSDIPKKTTWFDILMYKLADAYKYIRGLFITSSS